MRKQQWILDHADLHKIDSFVNKMQISLNEFAKTNDHKAIQAQILKSSQNRWRAEGNCYFKSCCNKSIANSHSLSNKLMLLPISESDFLYTPRSNIFDGKYEIGKKVHLNRASVFPGFCVEHENKFSFEKNGEITNEKELQMQLFRSVCRHVHFLKDEKERLLEFHQKIKKKKANEISHFITSNPELKTSPDEIKGFIENQCFGKLELMIEQREKDIEFNIKNWYEPNESNFGEYLLPEYYSELIVCTTQLPVLLSSCVLFDHAPRDEEGTPDLEFQYYVNIFPNKGKTHIYLVCPREKKHDLLNITEKLEKDGKNIQKFIMDLMLRRTDNWFVSPSFWDNLSDELKNTILNELIPKD